MSATNPHEEAARAKKVIDLSVAIDEALTLAQIGTHSPRAVEAVERMSVQGWLAAVKRTGREPRVPSETTKAAVVDLYRRRAAHAVRRIDGMDRARNRAAGIRWCP